MPSRPWLKANAHREGFCTRAHDMSLDLLVRAQKQQYAMGRGGQGAPSLANVVADVFGSAKNFQARIGGQLDILWLRAERRQKHPICERASQHVLP